MLYHTIMLLSLTDPFRLAEGEVGLLFDVLLKHANECRILPGNQWDDDGAGLFLVDLQSATQPEACSGLKSPAAAQEPYLLDARVALDNMGNRLSSTPARVRMQSPEAMLLRRLLPQGQGAGERREPRLPDGRHAGLLLGLEAVHCYLSAVIARQQADHAADTPGAETVTCTVVDTSKGGMRLVCDSGAAGEARVGDLLAILEGETGAQNLQLAMIRSLEVQADGGMEFGVQLMQGGLGPVSCRSPDDHEVAVRALFMPANVAEETAATLVAAKGLYEAGRHLLIDVGGREVSARAGRLVMESPVFDRFEFSAE